MIAYTSDITDKDADVQRTLSEIVRVGKYENQRIAVTGVLFYVEGKFLQIIEGPRDSIKALMDKIAKDPRHKNMNILIDTKVDSRGFASWSMESFELRAGKIFDFITLKQLTESFEKALLPRSNMLLLYYRALLEEKTLRA
ncbi:MAG: hypothetical protein DI626_09690 [Micavibrio aeruginosavorus]|uniref:BLUF domain-containing protein n=1 Tax=Micavibrio aeruginosavorus TaxID=349221 RepID=A0A2W4ZMK5_9BACT|nr:MAG: hypothetical protein DI626_09690 [Micavibrio aeruginosavorus]